MKPKQGGFVKFTMRTFFTTLLILCSTLAFGQDLKKIEQELLVPLSRISTVFNGAYYDTLYKDNETFEKRLKKYLSTIPSTMAYPFIELKKKGLSIAISDDNKLRIYSWDTLKNIFMVIFLHVFLSQEQLLFTSSTKPYLSL